MTEQAAQFEVCDFRQPRRPSSPSGRTIDRWLRDACTLIAERWQRINLSVKVSYAGTRTQKTPSALLLLADPGWGVHATFGAVPADSLIATTLPLMHALVAQLLGVTESEPDDDAEDDEPTPVNEDPLSAIEESMAELLVQEWLIAVGEAWLGAEPLDTRLVDIITRPRRTRLLPQRDAMIVVTLRVETSTDRGEIHWVLPLEAIEDLIEIECRELPEQIVAPDPQVAEIIRRVPVSLKVELGRVDLSMVELTSLEVDDVLVLDQSAAHPVEASIGDACKFRGRPVRMGQRRCLQIEEVLGTSDAAALSMQET